MERAEKLQQDVLREEQRKVALRDRREKEVVENRQLNELKRQHWQRKEWSSTVSRELEGLWRLEGRQKDFEILRNGASLQFRDRTAALGPLQGFLELCEDGWQVQLYDSGSREVGVMQLRLDGGRLSTQFRKQGQGWNEARWAQKCVREPIAAYDERLIDPGWPCERCTFMNLEDAMACDLTMSSFGEVYISIISILFSGWRSASNKLMGLHYDQEALLKPLWRHVSVYVDPMALRRGMRTSTMCRIRALGSRCHRRLAGPMAC